MNRVSKKMSLLCGVAAGAILCSAAALAQERTFSVPSEDAVKAIPEFARQAGVQIVSSADQLEGVKTSAVQGPLEPRTALKRLLSGTSIEVAADDGQTIVLRVAPKNGQAAQDEGAAESNHYALETVVVSGSRLTQTGLSLPTPTHVLGAVDLEQGDRPSLAELLADQPQFRAGLMSGAAATGNEQSGKYQADLRGLGAIRTLTLLNGHRFNGSGDLNTIPDILVSRVDIVTGGASAAWGSGAVAGVVNVILDDKLNGLKANLRSGLSTYGDVVEYGAAAAYGADFDGDRGHWIASASYSDQGGAYGRQDGRRPNTKTSLFTAADGTLSLQNPVNITTASPGGVITSGPLSGMQFNKDATLSPVCQGANTNAGLTIGGCGIGGFDTVPVSAPTQRVNGFARATYNVFSDSKAWVQVSYLREYSQFETFDLTDNGTLTISSNNPFLPAAVRNQLPPNSTFMMGRVFNDSTPKGSNTLNYDRNSVEFALGMDGGLTGGWTYSVFFDSGEYRNRNVYPYWQDPTKLSNAIDAVTSPTTGQPICRVALTDPTTACAPYNIFGSGNASVAALAYVYGPYVGDVETTRLTTGGLTVNGSPFSTWAGPVATALGFEARSELLHAHGTPGNQPYSYLQPVNGGFDVEEGFAEAAVPLLDAEGVAVVNAYGAARYSGYSNTGDIWSWKGGVTARLFDDLLLRAVTSRDIRSPNVGELFSAQTIGTFSVSDPQAKSVYTIGIIDGGNPNLKPEIGRTTTFGGTYTPSFVPGLGMSVDVYQININRAITEIAPQDVVSQCFNGRQSLCPLITRDAGGKIVTVKAGSQNVGAYNQHGIDFDLSYQFEASSIISDLPGDVRLHGLATYISSSTLFDGVNTIQYAGDVGDSTFPGGTGPNTPHWRSTLSVTYNNEGFGVSARMRYVGGGNYNSQLPIVNNGIGGRMYFDLGGHYDVGDVSLYGNVNNLFNADTPEEVYYAPIYDVVGRYFSTGVKINL